jgi:hypothetical protein
VALTRLAGANRVALALQQVLTARLEELPKESQKKRLQKVLKQLSVASGGR